MNFSSYPRQWLPALILFLLLSARTAPCLEAPADMTDASPISIEADNLTYDKAEETYHASGQVRLQKGEMTLTSENVEWNTETGEAVAKGGVLVTDPVGEMTGEELSLNLDSGQARLTQGRIFLKEQNFHLTGDEIEKVGELSYRVKGGTFTTCEGEKPSWKFGASRLDVTQGRYARARHVLFYIRDVPVFYAPYIIYPVKTERESGLLMPRYGYSEKRGIQLSMAYYHVIERNMDATFYLDYFSDLGVGKGIEYRYIFGEDNEGTANAYHVNGLEDGKDRSAFTWQHLGTLPSPGRVSADVEYVSTRDYYEDFGEEAGEYNKDMVQSVVTASRNWEKVNLTGLIRYTKTLEQNDEDVDRELRENSDFILQRLPEVNLTAIRQRLGESPVYLGFEGASTYFWRDEGVKGERLIMRPALSSYFLPGGFLEIRPEIGYRERLYWTRNGPDFEREGLFDFSTRLSTRFSRTFTPDHSVVKRIRHSIEPEILYGYIPSEDQSDLPQFDVEDEIGPENRIAYALTNRLTARLEPENGDIFYHEFLYLRLSQTFDIRESRRELLSSVDEREPFSDIRAELIVRPTRWSFLDVDARYDVNSSDDGFINRFPIFNARGGIQDGSGNEFSLDYRYRKEDLGYVAANLGLALFKPIYVNYRHRYDFDGGRILEQLLNLEYRAQCWSVYLTVRDRLEDQEYLITFALTGLGRVARFGGNLGRSRQ